MTQTYLIPHAISVFIDRSQPRAVLRAVAVKPVVDAVAQQEMENALRAASLEMGVKDFEIAWQDGPEPKP